MIDLSVIIVSYNVKELLENCIVSIFESAKGYSIEIIIVDNNSFDGSVEFLKRKFSNEKSLIIIESKTNLGFAKANNLGFTYAKGKYVLILNPDTVLKEDTIQKTIEYYSSDSSIGAVTCKLILPSGKLDLACRRSFPNPSVAVYRILGLSKLFPKSKLFGKYNLTYLDENETYEVDAICGAFMFLSKKIYKEIGGFDEDYFMYGEDLDFCFRIKKAGYKIYYYSDTSVVHYKGESTKKSSISYVNNFYGAMRIFVEKNMGSKLVLYNLIIRIPILTRSIISYLTYFFKSYYPLLLDISSIVLAILISIKLRFENFPLEAYTIVIIIYSIIWGISLLLVGTYKKGIVLSMIKPLNGILLGFFINSSLTYFFNEYAFSRVVVLRSTAYSYLFMILWRAFVRITYFLKNKDLFYKSNITIVVGINDESINFKNKLRKRFDTKINIVGFITVKNKVSDENVIGNINNIKEIILAKKVRTVIFTKSELTNQIILDLMWDLKDLNLNFKILSAETDLILGKSEFDKVDNLYLMEIEYNINKKINIFVKRLLDLFIGFICLVTIYPFIFIYYKILSVKESNKKFLNKVLLIPKVLSGKLTFVGRAVWDKTAYGKEYLGKNGLTGLVQINYYKNLTEDEIEYYNNYYAKNQSLTLDLEIILKTFILFIFRNKLLK